MISARVHVVRALLGAIVGALGFCAYVYLSNTRLLQRRYPVVQVTLHAAATPEAVQRGKALADITGCTDCHRADLRGCLFEDEGWLHGRYYASNLTLTTQTHSDEDLARIVRLGVHPDGRGVVAMRLDSCA